MASKKNFKLLFYSLALILSMTLIYRTTNPEWEKAYQYQIPVLAEVLSDGTEETLPRLSPRIGVELIQNKIAAALRQ